MHAIDATAPVPLVVIDDHPIVHTGVRHWVAKAAIPTEAVPAYRSVAQFLNDHQRHPTAPAVIVYDRTRGAAARLRWAATPL